MTQPVEHPEWGPNFNEYTNTYPLRLQSAFDRCVGEEEIVINASHNLIPLSLLETTLAVGENMHVVGFQTGDRIFPILVDTIKKYAAMHTRRIFDSYYGFLCIRHLIGMVCVGTLIKAGIFENILNELDTSMPWIDLLGVLSDETLSYMKALLDRHDKNDYGSTFTSEPLFLDDTSLYLDDAKFLLGLLWEARDSIMPLREQDALPGLPTLILVLSQLIGHTPSHIKPDWLCMQDISLRCYLGCLEDPEETSNERYVLQRLNEFILYLCNKQKLHITDTFKFGLWLAVDNYDAQAIVEMYSIVPSSACPKTPLTLHYAMLHWVVCLLRNPSTKQSRLDKLTLSVFKTALVRLQAEIDEEAKAPMSENARAWMRVSVNDTIKLIVAFGLDKQPEFRDVFLKLLFDSDICAIVGRVLALITRETEEPHDWERFLHSIFKLGKLLSEYQRLPPTYVDLVQYEWSRFLLHLMHLGWEVVVSSLTPKRLLEDARNTWNLLLGFPPQSYRAQSFMCAYPRCAAPESI